MEAVNEFTFWSLLLVALLLGVVCGFLLSYLWLNQDARARNLQTELEQTREELNRYRQKVNQHFQKTAELFEDMTERYREVYRHLATSSEELCGEQPPALQYDPASQPKMTHGHTATADEAGAPPSEAKESGFQADDRPRHAGDDDNGMLGDAPFVPETSPPDTQDKAASAKA